MCLGTIVWNASARRGKMSLFHKTHRVYTARWTQFGLLYLFPDIGFRWSLGQPQYQFAWPTLVALRNFLTLTGPGYIFKIVLVRSTEIFENSAGQLSTKRFFQRFHDLVGSFVWGRTPPVTRIALFGRWNIRLRRLDWLEGVDKFDHFIPYFNVCSIRYYGID